MKAVSNCGSVRVPKCGLCSRVTGGRGINVGFGCFIFLGWLVDCLLVGCFVFCIRVNNSRRGTLTLPAPGVGRNWYGCKEGGKTLKGESSRSKGRGRRTLPAQAAWAHSSEARCFLPSLSLLQITDSAGHILYAKEDATKGKFAFTTEDYDMFEACFESKLPVGKWGGRSVGCF